MSSLALDFAPLHIRDELVSLKRAYVSPSDNPYQWPNSGRAPAFPSQSCPRQPPGATLQQTALLPKCGTRSHGALD